MKELLSFLICSFLLKLINNLYISFSNGLTALYHKEHLATNMASRALYSFYLSVLGPAATASKKTFSFF
jgi:hypothetical protein